MQRKKESIAFSEWVDAQMQEKDLKSTDIERATGIDERMVSYYRKGENAKLPSTVKHERITNFLKSALTLAEFKELLIKLMLEFNVDDKELAKVVGVSIKTMNNYINVKDYRISFNNRQKMLVYFSNLCSLPLGGFNSAHWGTGLYLERVIECGNIPFSTIYDSGEKIGEKHELSEIVKYTLTLPIPFQEHILKHIEVYFDDLWLIGSDLENIMSYEKLASVLSMYRTLSETQKQYFKHNFMSETYIQSSKNIDSKRFTNHISAYLNFLSSDIPPKNAPLPNRKEDRTQFIYDFERASCGLVWFSDQQKVFEMKTSFTHDEWNLWMNLLIYAYNGRSLDNLIDILIAENR